MTTADTATFQTFNYSLYLDWLTSIGQQYKANLNTIKQPSDTELIDAMNRYFSIYDTPV